MLYSHRFMNRRTVIFKICDVCCDFVSDSGKANKSLLIVDARSYTAAFANRAKGGGFEYQGNETHICV